MTIENGTAIVLAYVLVSMGVIIAFILARLALRSRLRIAPHESEAVFHSCRYCGPTAGRFAAVAHARSATRCYYAARWIAENSSDIIL